MAKVPEGERSLSVKEEKKYVSVRECRVQEKLRETGRLDFEGLLGNSKTQSQTLSSGRTKAIVSNHWSMAYTFSTEAHTSGKWNPQGKRGANREKLKCTKRLGLNQ